MASRAIEIRLSQTERERASFKDSANVLQAHAARLEKKIEALRRSVFPEGTKKAPTTSSVSGSSTAPSLQPACSLFGLGIGVRILSFLTLGLVLLALGFIYNRWREALRKLL